MKWSLAILIVVGIVGALFAAVLMASLQHGGATAKPVQNGPDEGTIVVATASQPAMTVLSAGSVEMRKVPLSAVGPGSISHPASIIGRVLVAPVLAGQELTKSCFAAEGSGMQLSTVLPDTKRAMTISLEDYAGMEGLLYPGSIVDVLLSLKMGQGGNEAVSTTLLRGIQVLAVGKQTILSGDPTKPETPGAENTSRGRNLFVTVMVDTQQAQALQLAMENGHISLSMRNPTDVRATGAEATLLTQLSSQYGSWATKSKVTELVSDAKDWLLKPSDKTKDPTSAPAKDKPSWETTVIRGGQKDVQVFHTTEHP